MNTPKQIPQWRIVAASVCGTSHIKNQHLVTAAADGAGSAILGKVGAMIAVETAIEYISNCEISQSTFANDTLLRNLLTDAMLAAKKAVEDEAVACKHQSSDLATTLIIAIATPKVAAVAQIGDGLAVAKDSTGNLQALTIPNMGEYVNETTFLTSPDALTTTQIKILRQHIVNISVLTDGLQMLALNMLLGEPHKPFFFPLFDFVANAEDKILAKEQLVKFLCSEKITSRTQDDLTIIIASLSNL
jgi:hypothetical protein